jgi:DNA-binding CsgD family transcriptional regulator
MQQEPQNHPFFLEGKHHYLVNFLEKLGGSDLFSVCVKGIDTKQVCFNNTVCGKFWGLPAGAMEGMTAREIFTRVNNFTNMESELTRIEQQEQLAIQTRHQSIFQQVLLSYDGFLQVRQSFVIPLNNMSNRLIATAGIGLDVTHTISPLTLLDFYENYYPKKNEVIKKFLQHFKLDHYFYQPISYGELRLLITMLQDYRHRKIAESLSVSAKTVANYISSLKDKLKLGVDIYTVLSALRAQKVWLLHEADL